MILALFVPLVGRWRLLNLRVTCDPIILGNNIILYLLEQGMYRRILLTRDTHDVTSSTSSRVLHLHGVPPVHVGLGLGLTANILHLRLDAVQRLLGGSHLVVGLVPGLTLDVPLLVDDGVGCRQPLVVLLHHGGDLRPVHLHVLLQVSRLTEAPATGGADIRSLPRMEAAMNWKT